MYLSGMLARVVVIDGMDAEQVCVCIYVCMLYMYVCMYMLARVVVIDGMDAEQVCVCIYVCMLCMYVCTCWHV